MRSLLLKKLLQWYYEYRLTLHQRRMFECSLELHLYTHKSSYLKAMELSYNDYYKKKLRNLK